MVLLSGGLTVATFTAIRFVAPEMRRNPDVSTIALAAVIIAFFMLGLAPLLEWWFKLWRNVDRWCVSDFTKTGGDDDVACN